MEKWHYEEELAIEKELGRGILRTIMGYPEILSGGKLVELRSVRPRAGALPDLQFAPYDVKRSIVTTEVGFNDGTLRIDRAGRKAKIIHTDLRGRESTHELRGRGNRIEQELLSYAARTWGLAMPELEPNEIADRLKNGEVPVVRVLPYKFVSEGILERNQIENIPQDNKTMRALFEAQWRSEHNEGRSLNVFVEGLGIGTEGVVTFPQLDSETFTFDEDRMRHGARGISRVDAVGKAMGFFRYDIDQERLVRIR